MSFKPAKSQNDQAWEGACSSFNSNKARKEGGGKVKPTIEFRKLEGTIDWNVALAWCWVFVVLVEYARNSSKTKFGSVVAGSLQEKVDYGVQTAKRD